LIFASHAKRGIRLAPSQDDGEPFQTICLSLFFIQNQSFRLCLCSERLGCRFAATVTTTTTKKTTATKSIATTATAANFKQKVLNPDPPRFAGLFACTWLKNVLKHHDSKLRDFGRKFQNFPLGFG
jgi:hypothetical protein